MTSRAEGVVGEGPPPSSLALVIPAYRAAAVLPGLLARVRRAAPGAVVFVVDDGSGDGTPPKFYGWI